jgi:hypothetical protein
METKVANEIIEKAKTKNDGIYSHKGYKYIVIDNQFKAFCDFKTIYLFRGFTIKIKNVDEIYNVNKELQKLLQILKQKKY